MSLGLELQIILLVITNMFFNGRSLLVGRCMPLNSIRRTTATRLSMSSQASFLGVSSDESSPNYRVAAQHLQKGKLVSFPTETVYGLGANARDVNAITSIFTAKKRPLTDPLIVHILNKESMYDLFDFDDAERGQNNNKARIVCESLAKAFWPGPLTIIYKANKHKLTDNVISTLTANTGYLGIRVPKHRIARNLLKAVYPTPIAAPSANRFGHVSPTSPSHVMHDLEGVADLYILAPEEYGSNKYDDSDDAFHCDIGIESTVIRVSDDGTKIQILRNGAITKIELDELMSTCVKHTVHVIDNKKNSNINDNNDGGGDYDANLVQQHEMKIVGAVAPGQMVRHYAPDVPTYILSRATLMSLLSKKHPVDDDVNDGIHINWQQSAFIDYGCTMLALENILETNDDNDHMHDNHTKYMDLSPSSDIQEACRNVFTMLRKAEQIPNIQTIYVVDLSNNDDNKNQTEDSTPVGSDSMRNALWERLHRAASGEFR